MTQEFIQITMWQIIPLVLFRDSFTSEAQNNFMSYILETLDIIAHKFLMQETSLTRPTLQPNRMAITGHRMCSSE